MKVNKMIFWISFFVMIACVIMIAIFAPLYAAYGCEALSVFENIFISLIGGTWLSMMTAVVGFYYTKKRNIISFNEEYTAVLNKIKRLHNWFNLQYKNIQYKKLNAMRETTKDEENYIVYAMRPMMN